MARPRRKKTPLEQAQAWRDWPDVWDAVLQADDRCHPVPCTGSYLTPLTPFAEGQLAMAEACAEGAMGREKWLVFGQLHDGRWFFLEAGCSYTGWDFGSGEVTVCTNREHLLRYGLGEDERERLGLALPIPEAIRQMAQAEQLDPQALASSLRREQDRRKCTLDERAYAWAEHRDYWAAYGDEPVIPDALTAAQTVPVAPEELQHWSQVADWGSSGHLEAAPTATDLAYLEERFRLHLFLAAPKGPRERCAGGCGRWLWDVRAEHVCPVCGRPVCTDCAFEPFEDQHHRWVRVCQGCIARVPVGWTLALPRRS